MSEEIFATFAIIELFGYTKLAGRVSESHILGGHALLQLDIPDADDKDKFTTRLIGPAAIYSLTPTTEEVARAAARDFQPNLIHPWVPQISSGRGHQDYEGEESDEPPF
ncbi:MAG: hypothetical protein PHU23_03205 [Dehalococcoidales bacterium]|nr:hypothetical protein [Dehalococcoidales bacterium]